MGCRGGSGWVLGRGARKTQGLEKGLGGWVSWVLRWVSKGCHEKLRSQPMLWLRLKGWWLISIASLSFLLNKLSSLAKIWVSIKGMLSFIKEKFSINVNFCILLSYVNITLFNSSANRSTSLTNVWYATWANEFVDTNTLEKVRGVFTGGDIVPKSMNGLEGETKATFSKNFWY